MKSPALLSCIGIAVLMLVIGAVLGSVAFPANKTVTSTQFSTITSTQTEILTQSSNAAEDIQNYVSSASCPTLSASGLSLGNETSYNHQSDLAFLMKAGTASTLCLAYQLDNRASLPATVNFSGFEIQEVNVTTVPNEGGGFGYSYSYSPALGISEKASPSILTIPAGFNKSRIIVNYTITATEQAKGFYTLSYYETCPPLIPFSVGYGTAQINASDFEGFFFHPVAPSSPFFQIPK